MSYSQSDLSGREPLKNKIEEHEQNLQNWKVFLSLMENESDETISTNAEENNLVHYNSEINYSFDHDTLNSIDKLVAKNGGLIKEYSFYLANHTLKSGKEGAIKAIKKHITNEENVIKSFKASLENLSNNI